jgi:hypothetical protein
VTRSVTRGLGTITGLSFVLAAAVACCFCPGITLEGRPRRAVMEE